MPKNPASLAKRPSTTRIRPLMAPLGYLRTAGLGGMLTLPLAARVLADLPLDVLDRLHHREGEPVGDCGIVEDDRWWDAARGAVQTVGFLVEADQLFDVCTYLVFVLH